MSTWAFGSKFFSYIIKNKSIIFLKLTVLSHRLISVIVVLKSENILINYAFIS